MAIYTAIFLTCFLYMVSAYPTGAPEQACQSFRPNHIQRSTGQPYEAQNDQFDQDDAECPYDVIVSGPFTPGQPITLNITVRSHHDHFQGYMLTVADDDDNDESQGRFAASNNSICGGKTVTQSVGGHKKSELIEWIAPANSSKKTFTIWMTVVRSFSKYWVNCNPTRLPAIDADDQSIGQVDFDLPTENVHADKNSTGTSIFKDNKYFDSSEENNMNSKDMSSSSMIESEENPNSEGDDDSGDSIENSVDVSDNRSGSSLLSEEKEEKRQQYFKEGIENFDSDIKKFLVSVDKLGVYEQFKSGQFKSGSSVASALAALVLTAAAMLIVA